MTVKIRKGVFETNSSSVHSICISGDDRYEIETPDYEGTAIVEGGEYGWGYETLHGMSEKLSYVFTSIQYYDHDLERNIIDPDRVMESPLFQKLAKVVKDYTGLTLMPRLFNDQYSPMGYIDHQSIDLMDEYWKAPEIMFDGMMRELLFNHKIYIEIDNDNH